MLKIKYSIQDLDLNHQSIFPFQDFNLMQSKCLPKAYKTSENLVLSAPTGSGKTVVLQLAALRLINQPHYNSNFDKIIYIAPVKALCTTAYHSWSVLFQKIRIKCCELTGDVDSSIDQIMESQIIIATAEKLEAVTRKLASGLKLLKSIKLVLIDEVHFVSESSRGPTMEALVSRIKLAAGHICRFIAVSATVLNLDDIARWLGNDNRIATSLTFDESYRPVPLKTIVKSYNHSFPDSMAFDACLNCKVLDIIKMYADQKPTLIFCCTRKSASALAQFLTANSRLSTLRQVAPLEASDQQALRVLAGQLEHKPLKQLVSPFGVAFHHAGLSPHDRQKIENAFYNSHIKILCTTSTLAVGVNLPARLVIVKGTQAFADKQFVPYTALDMIQMVGRAGRAQLDTKGIAVIMTHTRNHQRWETMLHGLERLSSHLPSVLPNYLCAEINLGNVKTTSEAERWIRGTFYAATVGPESQVCLRSTLKHLAETNIIKLGDRDNIEPTAFCQAMSRYFVSYTTLMKLASSLPSSVPDMLRELSSCSEFGFVKFPYHERASLERLNTLVAFPLQQPVRTLHDKVYIIIQATLGSLNAFPNNWQAQDAFKLLQQAKLLCRCLAHVASVTGAASCLRTALKLTQSFEAKIWFDSEYNLLTQIDGIGLVTCRALANAGIVTFADIMAANPQTIGQVAKRQSPFGQQLKAKVAKLPFLDLQIASSTGTESTRIVHISISMRPERAQLSCDVPQFAHLVVCSKDLESLDEETLVHYQCIPVSTLTSVLTTKLPIAACVCELVVDVIIQDTVGLDTKRYIHFDSKVPKALNSGSFEQATSRISPYFTPKTPKSTSVPLPNHRASHNNTNDMRIRTPSTSPVHCKYSTSLQQNKLGAYLQSPSSYEANEKKRKAPHESIPTPVELCVFERLGSDRLSPSVQRNQTFNKVSRRNEESHDLCFVEDGDLDELYTRAMSELEKNIDIRNTPPHTVTVIDLTSSPPKQIEDNSSENLLTKWIYKCKQKSEN